MTLIAQNVFLPLVGITFPWALAGAVRGRSTLSVAFLEGGLAYTFSIVGSITVRAVEVTRIALGANRGRVIGIAAAASSLLDLQIWRSVGGGMIRQSPWQEVFDRAEDRWCEKWWLTHLTGYVVRDLGFVNDHRSRGKGVV